jgi:hypothetical protein
MRKQKIENQYLIKYEELAQLLGLPPEEKIIRATDEPWQDGWVITTQEILKRKDQRRG